MGGGILAKVSICLFELFAVALYYYGLGFCRQIKLKAKNGTKSNSANFSTLKNFEIENLKYAPTLSVLLSQIFHFSLYDSFFIIITFEFCFFFIGFGNYFDIIYLLTTTTTMVVLFCFLF